MSATDREISIKVKQWMDFANEDLHLAQYALEAEDCPCRLVAYHAQQCAEKYLKAFLVYQRVDFPFPHNISTLLELCAPYGDWIKEIEEAETLTAYAITTRYPGHDEQVSRMETQKAVEIAKKLRNILRSLLENALKA